MVQARAIRSCLPMNLEVSLEVPGEPIDEMAPYDYPLTPERIAQSPLEPRSSARLLDAAQRPFVDRRIADFASLCKEGDVVVVNDSRVLPARIPLRRATGGAVEFLLLEEREPLLWLSLCNPSRHVRPGSEYFDASGKRVLEVVERLERSGDAPVRTLVRLDDASWIETLGQMPLPPYIKTPLVDPERYQTVYSNRPSSAAAPTAGLHFDQESMGAILAAGAKIVKVELSVGLDTFLPIRTAKISDHSIHRERYAVSQEAWAEISRAKRVVAIGTTVVRTLESVASSGELTGYSSLFIHGDYKFKVVDRLMTNFHIPRSSLLLLVDAFVGGVWLDIYRHALDSGYRFLSFGDAMLIDRRR